MNEARQRIEAWAKDNGITLEAVFVPWSKSRKAKEKDPSLNWQVTLKKGDRAILTTDYGAGMAHCPSYKPSMAYRMSVDDKTAIDRECETGKTWTPPRQRPILPDLCDVLHCLCLDAEALEYGTFEEWADSFGYEADSRKAEGIYRACLEIALRLRQGLGEAKLQELREATQDY